MIRCVKVWIGYMFLVSCWGPHVPDLCKPMLAEEYGLFVVCALRSPVFFFFQLISYILLYTRNQNLIAELSKVQSYKYTFHIPLFVPLPDMIGLVTTLAIIF